MRELAASDCSWERKTLVLVGKTGNGKSATANSIIGRNAFESMPSFAAVTSTCQIVNTKLDDGQILNVIDTPGLFDAAVDHRDIAKEIARCIDLAKDGIHALLLVLSVRNRFSQEEKLAFDGLRHVFGGKIADYMIVVFTNGDALGKNARLSDFLHGAPEILTSTLKMCGNRYMLFDNVTEDEAKKTQQKKDLFALVNAVVDYNDGMPYTNDLFDELKGNTGEVASSEICHEGGFQSYERFERFIEMVESRLRESILKLENQSIEEKVARLEAEAKAQAARLEAEAKVQAAQAKSKDEMDALAQRLKKAEKKSKELEAKLQDSQKKQEVRSCVIS